MELLSYNDNVFRTGASVASVFSLEDEPFISAWEGYAAEAEREGIELCLRRRFVQFSFPIERGISETNAYRMAIRRGIVPGRSAGPHFRRPDRMRISIHQTGAGRIPLLITSGREDFVACVQALTKCSEPVPIPDSMGACMVAGFNNWDRIARLREQWAATLGGFATESAWELEFQRIMARKELYQDRFMILSDGPYSGIPAEFMERSEEQWRAESLIVRREHECAHYFTRRVFGSMRNNVMDELIADYMGIVAIEKRFRSDWFLRFMGIEHADGPARNARIHTYCAGLSAPAFLVLQRLLRTAAQNIETFQRAHAAELAGALPIFVLTEFTMEELAGPEAPEHLAASLRRAAVLQDTAAYRS